MIKLNNPVFDDEEIRYLRECLDSGWVTQGPFVARFEDMMKQHHEVAYASAVTSCTAGLHISALALGLGPGDEVLVPAFTWVTSANTAEYVGARAVFIDVDPDTYNMDPDAVAAAISPNTRAIVIVHLFGLAADMDRLLAIARENDLRVIEDAACAVGTRHKGRPVGGLSDIGVFSFHPRKAVTTGEGGLVCTNDEVLAGKVDALRNHGSAGPEPSEDGARRPWTMARFPIVGFNYRMSDIQAAVGVAQLEKLEKILEARRNRAAKYLELLAPLSNDVHLPCPAEYVADHSFQSFVIRLKSGNTDARNAVMQALADHGIETRPGTHAVHRLEYYARKYDIHPDEFPNASLCEDTTITLPLHPGLTDDLQETIVTHLTQALGAKRATKR